MRYFVGIDEAGRGALAGPVSVGAVLYPEDFDWREAFSLVTKRGEVKLKDSKKLSSQQRDILYEYITEHADLKQAAAMVSNEVIDRIGIVPAANQAVASAIAALGLGQSAVTVLLDAGLRAPSDWSQESHVRGDENIPAISFASIIAKVSRDRYMDGLAQSLGKYGFEKHKGYGTSAHYMAIQSHGISTVHRRTFLGLVKQV